MDSYLWWCGISLNASALLLCAYIIWIVFIWPAVEAFSQLRFFKACCKAQGTPMNKIGFKLWWNSYEIGGRSFDSMRNNAGQWHGVGRWHVYASEHVSD